MSGMQYIPSQSKINVSTESMSSSAFWSGCANARVVNDVVAVAIPKRLFLLLELEPILILFHLPNAELSDHKGWESLL